MVDPLDHLGLVHMVVHQFRRKAPRLDHDDLFQTGFLGLLRAVEKYDASTGNTFATYAVWWIRQAIVTHLKITQPMIRVPTAWPMRKRIPVHSLDVPFATGEERPGTLKDVVPDHDAEADIVDHIDREALRDRIATALGTMPTRDRTVLTMRYGLHGGHEYTLAEVAKVLRVTRERVRQIQVRAEARLRRRMVA